jgi:hypothetical protein
LPNIETCDGVAFRGSWGVPPIVPEESHPDASEATRNKSERALMRLLPYHVSRRLRFGKG